ncbi:NLR family CARD domain-containing protein 3-like [Chanos chanos]|uniref:NLR family CARD domain-containing protein 3-like n=1 Tax=Chanos chanos TaxID=29144 RepID=A0A6J2UU78_CHACN|nr:NLR family CARD domain-containing protein 3-like [Chanos chanos]
MGVTWSTGSPSERFENVDSASTVGFTEKCEEVDSSPKTSQTREHMEESTVIKNSPSGIIDTESEFTDSGATEDLFQSDMYDPWTKVKETTTEKLMQHFKYINEGRSNEGKPTLLNEVYTELYITEGGSGKANDEHEIRWVEMISKRQNTHYCPIKPSDIMKILPVQRKQIRTVLTKGIAGIGKTVSVQKFILDWAEGKANQDITVIVPLPFRDLNLKKENYSLIQLLHHYAPELKEIKDIEDEKMKLLLIFDGLDEYRFPLDFQNNEVCCDVTKSTSVDVLLTNLIKGNLLPSALLWITSQPAAANQIPPEYIHRVTEIRGFSDPQKEEYFRKRISDQSLANRIITHIRSSSSLYVKCHIPVFCWLSATVLENLMSDAGTGEIPKTLTEMYTHFLLIQISLKNKKSHGARVGISKKLSESDKEMILKLGKLAFQQLEKGNLIFYEEDLRECGIDVNKASEYSSVCTEIFREELGLYREKVFCFGHLSIQEYLAALYANVTCMNENKNVFTGKKMDGKHEFKLSDLHRSAAKKVLQSKSGYLDLLLSFLLGLTLISCQSVLQQLISGSCSEKCEQSMTKTTMCINEWIKTESSPETIISLFHCLNELKDNSLVEEIQTAFRSGTLSDKELEPHQCSALVYVLLMSEEVLDEFDLKMYKTSAVGQQRLLPVLRTCRSVSLSWCGLTEGCCEDLALVLRSPHSNLREMELRDNDLQNSGVMLLSAGLGSPQCKLEKLGLSGCLITEEGCVSLASALISNPTHLRELDLSYNHLENSGVNTLFALLEDPHCRLEKLELDHSGVCWVKPGPRKYGRQLTLDQNTAHRSLSLSEENRRATWSPIELPYIHHPNKFKVYPQVLCKEALTERCYWEVEWSGTVVDVGITCKYFGMDSGILGMDHKSFNMSCSKDGFSFFHNGKIIATLSHPSPSTRVGVYLDWDAGTLSFYSISSDTLILLHTFLATFTEPLYAKFGITVDSTVTLCNMG